MRRPVVHLICNAHLDPVWMWNWEEGLREAISTFRSAAARGLSPERHQPLLDNLNQAAGIERPALGEAHGDGLA